jgi:putative spermidine/putrescine transport system ATP-binding protein
MSRCPLWIPTCAAVCVKSCGAYKANWESPSIHVTHSQEEAMALADLMVVMEGGKIRQMGTPQEVYKHPRTTFVVRFIGGSNLLSGEVVASHDRHSTVQSQGGARFTIPIDAAQVGDKVVCSSRCDKTGLASSTVDTNALPDTGVAVEYCGAWVPNTPAQ